MMKKSERAYARREAVLEMIEQAENLEGRTSMLGFRNPGTFDRLNMLRLREKMLLAEAHYFEAAERYDAENHRAFPGGSNAAAPTQPNHGPHENESQHDR